jgi:hypothetical protein
MNIDPLSPYIVAAENALVARDSALKNFIARRQIAQDPSDIQELEAAIAILRFGAPPQDIAPTSTFE